MKKLIMTLALVLVVGTATVVHGGDVLSSEDYSRTPVDGESFIFLNKTNKKVTVVVRVNGKDSEIVVDAEGITTTTGTFARAEKIEA